MATSEVLNTGVKKVPVQPRHDSGPPRKSHGLAWFLAIVVIAGGGYYYYRQTHATTVATDSATGGRGPGRGPGAGGPASVGVVPVVKRDVPFYLTGLGS